MKFLCIISILCVFTNAGKDYLCYEESDQYWHFPLKTTYKSVSSKNIELQETKKCTPVKLFMVIRNGTSNVSKNFVEEKLPMLNPFVNKITENAKMCQRDIEAIRNWKTIVKRDKNYYHCLTENGLEEIQELALRIKDTFSDIFSKPQNSDNYNVFVMPNKRCEDTGEIFIRTIFGSKNIDKLKTDDHDQIVENLVRITRKINESTDRSAVQMVEFGYSDIMKNVVIRVADKMGIEPKEIKNVLKVIYDVCAYERSYAEKVIPAWCRVFCQEDLEVLEYYEDLHWYYAIGHGTNENGYWACPMAISLLDTFKRSIFSGDTGPYGTIHFTSHEFVLGMYLLLGIGKNESDNEIKMDSSNYDSMKDREWKTSLFSPWAANVTAVLYKCYYGCLSPTLYKIAFYSNENLMAVPMKGGSTCEMCLWPIIEEKIQIFIKKYECHKFLKPKIKNQPTPNDE